jgi:hypothetical protein
MLADASRIAGRFSGIADVWQSPFANPNPTAVMEKSSVWFTAYPISMIPKPGHSFLGTLGDEKLWEVLAAIGINAVHTGPLKRAGGVLGRELTPSVDGHFDRISTQIDDAFGTEDEFRRMCEVAAGHLGMVIDDIVPGRGARRDRHRRHRSRAYREGPGFPAGGDERRGLSRDLPHGGDSP